MPTVLLGDSIQFACQHVQLAGHGYLQDQPFTVAHQIVKCLGPAGKAAVDLLKRAFLRVIDEDSVHQIHETVSGGALDGPGCAKLLMAYENFFCNYIECS